MVLKKLQKYTEMFILWRAGLRLSVAARKADKAHAATGDRYYVMPDPNDCLVVLRRRGMRLLRRRGVFEKRVRMVDLQKESFYFTPDRGEHTVSAAVITAKRQMYLKYVMHNRRRKL